MIHINITKSLIMTEGKTDFDLRLSIPRGSFIAVTGKSGSGKTTLLRILAGLTAPDQGRIVVGSHVWYDSRKKINLPPQKRKTGLVFQDYALFPHMTVRENIAFANDSKKGQEINHLLDMMELGVLADCYPATLSGGQKQRVALARALVREPDLLLLDEPLSSLDDCLRNKLQMEMKQIHKMFNVTMILVSHDVKEMSKLASHVIVLDRGQIMVCDNPLDLYFERLDSDQFTFKGEILKIIKTGLIFKAVICIGRNIKEIYLKEHEARDLVPGSKVTVTCTPCTRIIEKVS